MKHLNSIFALFILLLLAACTTPESMRDFDSDTWKADKNGCEAKRTDLVPAFEKFRKDMIGKKEYLVRSVLGKPDKENLLKRSERIYYYYIEPGDQCQNKAELSDANRVEVRINSLGKVSSVNYYQPDKITKPE